MVYCPRVSVSSATDDHITPQSIQQTDYIVFPHTILDNEFYFSDIMFILKNIVQKRIALNHQPAPATKATYLVLALYYHYIGYTIRHFQPLV